MIELVWETGCPFIESARDVIREALRQQQQPIRWGEWDREDPLTPASRAGYGSPSVLIGGADVAGAAPAGASCCRVYHRPDGEVTGAPSLAELLGGLQGDQSAGWSGFPRIETDRLVITIPSGASAPAALAYFDQNREHLTGWDPVRPDAFYTEEFWLEQLALQRAEFLDDRSACFFGQLHGESELIGVANLRNIVRGSFQACHLGYSISGEHEGQGLMSEMVGAVVDFAFEALELHRVMANYLPENERSARLLERLGFEKEGYARDYLKIAGEWRDHVLTAKTAPKSA